MDTEVQGRVLQAGLLLSFALAACGDFKADFDDAKKSQTDINSTLGVDSQVTFRSFLGTKGKRLNVSVNLKTPPPTGDVAAFKVKVTDIVARDFRTDVDNVSVAF
jgi:hypothetical protein